MMLLRGRGQGSEFTSRAQGITSCELVGQEVQQPISCFCHSDDAYRGADDEDNLSKITSLHRRVNALKRVEFPMSKCGQIKVIDSVRRVRIFLMQGLLCRESQSSVVPQLLDYVNNSCTPFHAACKHNGLIIDSMVMNSCVLGQVPRFNVFLQPNLC